MKPAVFKMLQDHLHGNRMPKHPAVCRHPKGGVPAGGHRAHVPLPPHLHHHAVYRGPSPGAVLQMLPNVQVASGGERSQLPVCFCAVRSGGGIPMPRNAQILPPYRRLFTQVRKGCSLSQTQAEYGLKTGCGETSRTASHPGETCLTYWKRNDSILSYQLHFLHSDLRCCYKVQQPLIL